MNIIKYLMRVDWKKTRMDMCPAIIRPDIEYDMLGKHYVIFLYLFEIHVYLKEL